MSTDSKPAATAKPARLDIVDALRGFAVVFMIFWHTVDGWLFPEARSLTAWNVLRLIGGLAAPLFHLLAGISIYLKASGDRRRGTPWATTRRGLVIRGLEVLTLAYALRFQMWAVDKGGFLSPIGAVFFVLGLAGIFGVVIGLERVERRDKNAYPLLIAALASYAVGLVLMAIYLPSHVAGLLRIDVLHSLGASMVIVTLLTGPLRLLDRGLLALLFAMIVAAAAPWLERVMPGPLPDGIAGYLSKWTPAAGERPATLFPLFPWMAFVFIGLALGPLMSRAAKKEETLRVMLGLAGLGVVMAVVLHPSSPVGSWLNGFASPGAIGRVAYRTGLCLATCAPALIAARSRAVCDFGRASLPVYWLHLEFAFGIVARPIKQQLGWIEWAIGFALLLVLMWGVARVYLGPYRRWRNAGRGSA